MNRHEFLSRLHEVYQPRTYFEIGVNDGRSLTLSRVPSVAVDPAHKVTTELRCDLHLIKSTSDDFFAREKPFEHLGDEPLVDLAFIDGMHLFEFALRDFINAEKYADWSSVIVFDDQLPRNVPEAARDRHTTAWTGDVYKIIPALQRYRPDLRVAVMDTSPTGVVVVFGADPSSTVLSDKYDEIMDTYLLKDPQQIPEEILTRSCAMSPEALFEAPFWSSLVAARDSGQSGYGREQLVAEIDKAFENLPTAALGDWTPDPSVGRDTEPDPAGRVARGTAKAFREARSKKTAASKPSGTRTKPATTASTSSTAARAKASARTKRPDDLIGKIARKAPFLRKFPGARAVARRLRSAS
ncbi:MAG TPA: class I SAM-dependent methyltransferase [Actinopolymorphaceae bacterium]